MGKIQKLPNQLINKIAAGEVVERPASVVKELLENAIDAGASRIEVRLEGGGSRLISVTDDGAGIPPEELVLAVTNHATSKIRRAEDLFGIESLGFRGEALASIASVSHFRIASRAGDEQGAELKVKGGRKGGVKSAGLPQGTQIEVGDLFYNVPARRAFLRTERAETRAVIEELKRQALSRPEVALRASADDKVVLEASATSEPRERIAQLLGRELAEDLLALPLLEEGGLRLRGYITPCDRSRGNSRQQFFFLRGRVIRDVTLLSAVKTAYANLLPPRRHPSVLLWLDLDPSQVDVNVHPQKAEVRFLQDRLVFRLVMKAIQATLREQGLVRAMPLPRDFGASPGGSAQGLRAAEATPREGSLPFLGSPGASLEAGAAGTTGPPSLGRVLQIHRRYVLEESPAGLRIVDPHALHERILYEQILERLKHEPLESQRFLFPILVELEPAEALALEEREETLRSLGFEAAPFGKDTLAVYAAPRLLKSERIQKALKALLEVTPGGGLGEEEEQGLLHQLAASLACRSAIRFGTALPQEEVEELLRQRDQVPRGHCCPHGRPTALALSLDELDQRFGRKGASG